MMPTAAVQHSARLEGVKTQLLRILPPAATHETAGPGARPREERRLTMNTKFLMATRAYATLKGSLALVGVAALAAFIVLPQQREALLAHLPAISLPGLAVDPFASTMAAGPIQVAAVETPLEREQRTVTEYIAKRYRV